jgi:hypothetical protein
MMGMYGIMPGGNAGIALGYQQVARQEFLLEPMLSIRPD